MERRLTISILIGGTLEHPLPSAVEFAHLFVNGLQNMEVGIEVVILSATKANLKGILKNEGSYIVFFGHGDKTGCLAFSDGPITADEWNMIGTSSLGGVFIFACHGSLFARGLECPWISFDKTLKAEAPKSYMLCLFEAWMKSNSLRNAIGSVWDLLNKESLSILKDGFRHSANEFQELPLRKGSVRLPYRSARMNNWMRLGFLESSRERAAYPGFLPFVGRKNIIKKLAEAPGPFSVRKAQQLNWIWGPAGIGKSAILRFLTLHLGCDLFLPAPAQMAVVHVSCHDLTHPSEVKARLIDSLRKTFSLEKGENDLQMTLASLQKIFSGVLVLILDDLSYIEDLEYQGVGNAEWLVDQIVSCAQQSNQFCKVIASSRRKPEARFNPIEIGSLSESEIIDLAISILEQEGQEEPSVSERYSALKVANFLGRNTALVKKAFWLGAREGRSFSEYAIALSENSPETGVDEKELSERMIQFELETLSRLNMGDFDSVRFLKSLYPLYTRVGAFSVEQAASWFGQTLAPKATNKVEAFLQGFRALAQLGFLDFVRKEGKIYFEMPANQWIPLRYISKSHEDKQIEEIIDSIKPGHASYRFSMAKDFLISGKISEGIRSLEEIELDYSNEKGNPEIDKIVIEAILLKAQVTCNFSQKLAWDYLTRLKNNYQKEYGRKFPVLFSTALFNQGVAAEAVYGPEKAILIYESVIEAYITETDPECVMAVALSMLNIGVAIEKQHGPSERSIAMYQRIIDLFQNRNEVIIAEQVARAMFSMANSFREMGRSKEAIETYNSVSLLFAQRKESRILHWVATSELNMAFELISSVGHAEAAIILEKTIESFGDNEAPEVLEQVIKAYSVRSDLQRIAGRTEESIQNYDAAIKKYSSSKNIIVLRQLAQIARNRALFSNQDKDGNFDMEKFQSELLEIFSEHQEKNPAFSISITLFMRESLATGEMKKFFYSEA